MSRTPPPEASLAPDRHPRARATDAPAGESSPAGVRYVETRQVRSVDIGPDHRLTIPALLRQLHDVAQAHASVHDYGYRGLARERRAWALVGLDLAFPLPAPAGETAVTLATTVSRAAGPVVYRDYFATDERGCVARGQSMWALIDLDTRQAATPSPPLRSCLRGIARPDPTIPTYRRLPAPAPRAVVDHREVRLHDCDFNGHLNNVTTVQWLLDALERHLRSSGNRSTHAGEGTLPHCLASLSAKRLRVGYHAEALLGQRLALGLEALVPNADGRLVEPKPDLGPEGARAYGLDLRKEDGTVVTVAELWLRE